MTIVLSTLLMSTNSSSPTFLLKTKAEKRTVCSRRSGKILRSLTRKGISIGGYSRRRRHFRQTLKNEPRAVFRNVEAKLDVCALDIHLRRLGVEKKLRVGDLEQKLRLVPNPG